MECELTDDEMEYRLNKCSKELKQMEKELLEC